MEKFFEVGDDDWFESVTKFLPASTVLEEGAKDADFFFETFLTGENSSKANSDSETSCMTGRGFCDTDIVLIEAKNGKSALLGSGVLLQNPSTWGRPDKSITSFSFQTSRMS